MTYLLDELAEIMIGHTFRGTVVHNPKGDTFIVQSKDIGVDGELQIQKLSQVNLGGSRSKAYLQKGDILLSSRGTFKAGLWKDSDLNALATATLYVIRLKTPLLSPEFLELYLNSSIGQNELQKNSRGATIPALPKSNLIQMEIPIPPQEVQNLMVDVQKNWRARKTLLQKKQNLSQELVDCTLRKILTKTV